jgi:uncharacterized protein (DUF302 family)
MKTSTRRILTTMRLWRRQGKDLMYNRNFWSLAVAIVASIGLLAPFARVEAKESAPRVVHATKKPFEQFTQDLAAAIRQNKLGLVCRASARAGAASIGVKIPGNQVFMVFRPDFAVRMLEADVEAGFEAPLRIYVTEQPDGSAQVSYLKPSDVFAGYNNPKLDAMAQKLDTIFAAIIRDAMQ